MTELLKSKIDLVFKAIFGSEQSVDILESFLCAVLNIPSTKQIRITIKDPFTKLEKINDKYAIIDLVIETEDEIILTEIQLNHDPAMTDRILYGLSKTITNQKNQGDGYQLKKVVAIVITDYTTGP